MNIRSRSLKKISMLLCGSAAVVTLAFGSAQAQAATLDTTPIWRTQIEVQTCDSSNAGTDDSVYVELNGSGERFYLDLPGNDRERNETNIYDVVLPSVRDAGDITKITLHKEGTDAWCIRRVALYVNGIASPVFNQTIAGSGTTIDGDPGYLPSTTFSSATLRGSGMWNLSGARSAIVPTLNASGDFVIDHLAIESIITGVIGDRIHYNGLYWGGKHGSAYVESYHQAGDGPQTTHVDLDLKYETGHWYLANPEVDIDFDLTIQCSAGKLQVVPSNVTWDLDFPDVLDVLTLGLLEVVVEELAEDAVNDNLDNALGALSLGLPTPVCPTPSVASDGTVTLSVF